MSAESNVFNENVDFLIKAKEKVVELDKIKAKNEEIKSADKKLLKQIAAEEKSIADEISSTLKKRQSEISGSYDKELDANRNKVKDIKAKRSRVKDKRVNERVDVETADLHEENRQLSIEVKTLFKKHKVPGFCNTHLYYALFMPKGISEIFTMLLGFIIGIGGLPALAYFLVKTFAFKDPKKTMDTILAIVIVAGVIVIVFVLYFLMFNITKLKHRDTLRDGRKIRDKVKANKKNIKAIKNAISKDKDESGYDLNKYDKKIQDLDDEADVISRNKQEALTIFENETKNIIIDEINHRRLDKVHKMKSDHKKREVAIHELEGQISELGRGITNQYESYIGKEFCTADKLTDLITLMEEGTADTVSQAIAAYKGK